MVCAPLHKVGDLEHHQHAMAASAGSAFAQRSGQYPARPGLVFVARHSGRAMGGPMGEGTGMTRPLARLDQIVLRKEAAALTLLQLQDQTPDLGKLWEVAHFWEVMLLHGSEAMREQYAPKEPNAAVLTLAKKWDVVV
jgi:hypothetical protein